LQAVNRIGRGLRRDDMDARRKIAAVRLERKNAFARMIDDAGRHAGLTADTQGLIYVYEFMHWMASLPE
jgi:hypothetical protein